MKKNGFFSFLLFAGIAMIFCFASCSNGNDDSTSSSEQKEIEQKEPEIDYTDYSASDYVIKVKNNTLKKLVAFKGTPSSENLIGGIPASAANFGLKRSASLFASSTDFVLFLVSEEDYLSNKENLSRLATSPFGRLYAYYNSNSKNNIVYEISSVMGGNSKIILNNNTNYNVELRKDGIYGETIGYTGARTINTTFHVDNGDYYVFPVFRKFDTTLNEIVTVYPKYTTGNAAGNAIVETFSLSDQQDTIQLDASRWSNGVTFTSGYSYIRINNQSSVGLQMFDGANNAALETSTGITMINSGSSHIFALQMELDSSNASSGQYIYASSKDYAQLRVGNSIKSDYYLTGSQNKTQTFEAGKIYEYTITGENIYSIVVETTPKVSEMPEF